MHIVSETTQPEYRELAEILAKARKKARNITVPRSAFAHLFIDHGRLLEGAQSRGHIVVVRAPKTEIAP